MLVHSIAGLLIGMDYKHPRMINRSAAYVTEPAKTDFDILITNKEAEDFHSEFSYLSYDECEYMQTGYVFYRNLVDHEGMLLHASAVIKDGRAYLFSAPSGTGKSTHTKIWLKNFPDARILNDDKPAIRIFDGEARACGTPWSGKSDLNLNLSAPIGGICFLKRSEKNHIREISKAEAIPLIMNQTVRPKLQKNIDKMLITLGNIIEKTSIYIMGCNMEDEAAKMSYDAMSK